MPLRERIEAIHQGDLGTLADRGDPSDGDLLTAADRIAHTIEEECDRVITRLTATGITVENTHTATIPTRHEIVVDVADPGAAEAAAEILAADGYERWDQWTGAALASFHRHGHRLTVARTDDRTTLVRLQWTRGGARSRFQRLWKPTAGDWAMIDLPTWASRGYPIVRMIRLATERLATGRRARQSLGPFLATPRSLLDPLLDFAAAAPDEVVLDLGCGDGRLLVAAAERGSRAVGVDRSPELVDRARTRARAAGVEDRVRLEVGDARTADVGEAHVVFAFLPSEELADLLPSVLASLSSGARIVAHEQTRLPERCPRPDETRVLVGDQAITVAHRWTARPGRGDIRPGPAPS